MLGLLLELLLRLVALLARFVRILLRLLDLLRVIVLLRHLLALLHIGAQQHDEQHECAHRPSDHIEEGDVEDINFAVAPSHLRSAWCAAHPT